MASSNDLKHLIKKRTTENANEPALGHQNISRYEEVIKVKNKAVQMRDEPNQQITALTVICREANFMWRNQPGERFVFNRHLLGASESTPKGKHFLKASDNSSYRDKNTQTSEEKRREDKRRGP